MSRSHFDAKLKMALDRLCETRIWPSHYASPLYRLLWRLGVNLPPPHFNGFLANFAVSAAFFGIVWGLLMGLTGGGWLLRESILAGGLFGLWMAIYYRFSARKHKLPS